MKKFRQQIFLVCGLLLTLAAVPVFAQQEERSVINKMPFIDFARNINKQIEAGKVDLTESFSVELEGVLTKDGRFDAKRTKLIKSRGDAAMVEAGKNFIIADSDSGFLQYLYNLGAEKLTFTVSQNDGQVNAIIKSETAAVTRAKTMASGFNLLLKAAATQNKSEDDKALINYFSVAANDKNFIINFTAPREAIHELLKKHLEKMTTKPTGE